jgi:hypothetical protein
MQTTAGEARVAGQRHGGDAEGGGGEQPTKGLGEEKTWHALFDRCTDYRDYSMVSSKWAFRAHSNVVLLF